MFVLVRGLWKFFEISSDLFLVWTLKIFDRVSKFFFPFGVSLLDLSR